MKDNRCELIKGNIIIVAGKDYIVDSVIGRGASCICYKAYTKEAAMIEGKPEIKTWRVIKEFYPVNIAIRDSFMKVVPAFDDLTTWENSQKRWKEAVDKGREFQAQDGNNFMEIEVADLSYTVMRLREGMTLGNWVQKNIPAAQNDNSDDERVRTQYVVKCLNILRDLCACIEKYQGDGKIHFDVKPENIYILADNNDKIIVRLIDYDSLMTKEEFYKIAGGDGKISMYSTRQYYGEEVWSLRSDWKAAATDENVWKQVDVYALGKVLQYMLTGNADDTLFFDDDFEWFKDKDPVIKRTSSRRYVLNGFIKKATNVFGHRYSDASTVKFVVENILGLFHDNNFEMFDGFNKYRDELVPELMVDGISYAKCRGKAPIVQVFEEYCVRKNRNICIVAESGMGKSTALRKLFIDKILENQQGIRFYYFPLRDCDKPSKAKNLFRDTEYNFCYPSYAEKIFLFDAFDETDEDNEDLQDILKRTFSNVPQNSRVVLASRFKVNELHDYKIVECGKIGLTNYSDEIIRIKNNSNWLERVGIDIFRNPLFIAMSENIEQIKNYIIHDKDSGRKAWAKIEAELLGEYINGKLTVNYAGELIWNYVYVTLFSEFVRGSFWDEVVKCLNSISFCHCFIRISGLSPVDKIQSELSKENIFVGENIIKEISKLLKRIIAQKDRMYYIFWLAKCLVQGDYIVLSDYLDQRYNFPIFKGERSLKWLLLRKKFIRDVAVNIALEISGFKYNIFQFDDKFVYGSISAEKALSFSDVLYFGNRKYLQSNNVVEMDNLKLSLTQEENRYFIYKWLRKDIQEALKTGDANGYKRISCAAYALLLTQNSVSLFNFSMLIIDNIYNFNNVTNCKFDGTTIRVKSGKFVNCMFKNLGRTSVLNEDIYNDNDVDKKYEYCDEFNNCITTDGKYLVALYDYDKMLDNIKNKLIGVLPYALESCVNNELFFGDNFEFIDFNSPGNIFLSENDNYEINNIKNVIVSGNAELRGINFIKNIEVYNSDKYIYKYGVIYRKGKRGELSLFHLNRNLPKRVVIMPYCSFYPGVGGIYYGCEELVLPESKGYDFIAMMMRSICFVDLKVIKRLPEGFSLVADLIVNFSDVYKADDDFTPPEIVYNICSNRRILYIPEDLGVYLDDNFFRVNPCMKFFRPYSFHHNNPNVRFTKEYKLKCSAQIPWDHTFDGFWSSKFSYILFTLFTDDYSRETYSMKDNIEFIDAYEDLTEDEKVEVNEQHDKWIDYIKSLPPGKKYHE